MDAFHDGSCDAHSIGQHGRNNGQVQITNNLASHSGARYMTGKTYTSEAVSFNPRWAEKYPICLETAKTQNHVTEMLEPADGGLCGSPVSKVSSIPLARYMQRAASDFKHVEQLKPGDTWLVR